MLATAFHFLDTPSLFTLVDHELELVEPDLRHADELLAACHHPLTQELMPAQAKLQRDGVETFIAQNPRGHSQPEPAKDIAPGYTFWMRMRRGAMEAEAGVPVPEVVIAGSISLRIGHSLNLDRYLGHIGYHVLPPARGRHFAERACRLILPIARAHGHEHLWITCNPENAASRRTCERLGAQYVDVVNVPKENALYSQGDRQKCRYRMGL
ncbi:MAG TPA: GNAT family N-acetyltransferase [Phycisphaerae bacterium]